MSRLLGGGALVLLQLAAAVPAVAQSRVTSFEELRRHLRPGDEVSVARTSGEPVRGRVVALRDAQIDIRAAAKGAAPQEIAIPANAIRWLERRRDSSRNGTLIGAGIGAAVIGVFFIRALAIDRNDIDGWGPVYAGGAALFAGIGAFTGWAIDAMHSKPALRFEAASIANVQIGVTPRASRRPGVAVTLSFSR